MSDHMDSRVETYAHIQTVQGLLRRVIVELLARQEGHDRSKLTAPEVSYFDEFTPRLRGSEYDSEEYWSFLEAMRPGLAHHYAANDHHPEHYEHGIRGMSLVSLLEMLADWKAATLRHDTGDIRKSIELNQRRFGYSDELKQIMLNTLPLLEGDGA